MKRLAYAICLMIAFIPGFVLAHPGHGETEGFSIIHYFIEPMHAVITLSVVAVAYLLYRSFKNKKQS